MADLEPIPDHVNRNSKLVVDAAFKVHSALGPGLLESVYETCLLRELVKTGLSCQGQKIIPIHYDGEILNADLRLDILVEDCLIIEVKAVETWNKVYDAQMLTYLKLTGKRLGFLINLNVPLIRQGIRRVIR